VIGKQMNRNGVREFACDESGRGFEIFRRIVVLGTMAQEQDENGAQYCSGKPRRNTTLQMNHVIALPGAVRNVPLTRTYPGLFKNIVTII
jgi:hypothetical protein